MSGLQVDSNSGEGCAGFSEKAFATYAKPKWTLFFQEKPMQNLSGRDFFKKKTLWLGFGEAKPNLTFFRRKNHVHLRF